MNNKKIIIFPGAFQFVKNYGNYDGADIWLKNKSSEKIQISEFDYIVGYSLGASFALSLFNPNRRYKFILINPPLKKNIIVYFWRWVLFISFEGIKRKIIPVSSWFYAFKKVIQLMKIDTWSIIQKISKEDLIIIRGMKDNFFCDKEMARKIKEKNLTLIEVNAGHDWNDKITLTLNNLISA